MVHVPLTRSWLQEFLFFRHSTIDTRISTVSQKFWYQSPRDAASYPTRMEAYNVWPHPCHSQYTALRSSSIHVMHLLFFLVPLLTECVSVLQFGPVELTPKVPGALPLAPSKITTTFPHRLGYSVRITRF